MDQLERHHSNGPRSVSPGGVFRDLMVNKDLPVEQAIQRDQIPCHQPARGGVCSTSPGGEGHVVCASKAESLTSTAAEQLLVCRLRWFKGRSGARNNRSWGWSCPHSTLATRADSVRNCWHCRQGKEKGVGQPKAKIATE